MHGAGTSDADGEPVVLEDGFLGSLRPYRGLIERNFHEVMEALLVAGDTFSRAPQVDRDVVESVWLMCSLARSWGMEPGGMLRRNDLITPPDAKRLEAWVSVIERTAWRLLRGQVPHEVLDGYAEYVAGSGW